MFSIFNKNKTGLQDKVAAPQTKTDLSDWALLIIDMQDEFLCRIPREEITMLINSQLKIIEYCKNNKIPILNLRYSDSGNVIQEITNSLKHYSYAYSITKDEDNAFSDVQFVSTIEKLAPKNLIVTGVNDYACVFATTRSALYNKYQVFTAPDLIAGDDPEERSRVEHKFYKKEISYFNNHILLLNAISPRT